MVDKNSYILYEDEEIIVCDKPAGLAVQTKKIGEKDLESILLNHLSTCTKGRPYLAVIHRLDQPVSGIVLFAKNAAAAANLTKQLTEGRFEKIYMAVVCGNMPAAEGTLTDYLLKDGRTNSSKIVPKGTLQAKKAELTYQVVESDLPEGYSAVRIKLGTGRHHQIRVQLAGCGAPIFGDGKYNPAFQSARGGHTLALRASKLTFRHPKTGREMVFEVTCDFSDITRE